jgi:hypothetical protein
VGGNWDLDLDAAGSIGESKELARGVASFPGLNCRASALMGIVSQHRSRSRLEISACVIGSEEKLSLRYNLVFTVKVKAAISVFQKKSTLVSGAYSKNRICFCYTLQSLTFNQFNITFARSEEGSDEFVCVCFSFLPA